MTGTAQQPSIIQRQPALTAGGITAIASAVLAAFWAVMSDAGALTWLSPSTQALVTGAIIAVVAGAAAWWAQRRSTSISAPKLQEGTHVEVYDAAGATTGHVQVNAPVETPSEGQP